jgi:hypothetical protein
MKPIQPDALVPLLELVELLSPELVLLVLLLPHPLSSSLHFEES